MSHPPKPLNRPLHRPLQRLCAAAVLAAAALPAFAQTPTDSIRATPCLLQAGQTSCTTTVHWQSSSPLVDLYVRHPYTGVEQLWAAGQPSSGSGSWGYTNAWPGLIFEMRAGNTVKARSRVYAKLGPVLAQPGGSNIVYYNVEYPPHAVHGAWEKYTPYARFNEPAVAATLNRQLTEMYWQGQRSLRLHIPHSHAYNVDNEGWACGSRQRSDARGTYYLDRKCQDNLKAFLTLARDIGFTHFELASGQFGPNQITSQCATPNDPLVVTAREENFQVLRELRDIARAVNVPYVMDLANEASPVSISNTRTCEIAYLKTLWERYVEAYGSGDTIGFSIMLNSTWDVENRFGQIAELYGKYHPDVYSVHIYSSDLAGSGQTTADILAALRSYRAGMAPRYRDPPLMIGEAYLNDTSTAKGVKAAADAGDQIVTLTQWPVTRTADSTATAYYSPLPPVSYSYWRYAQSALSANANPQSAVGYRLIPVNSQRCVEIVGGAASGTLTHSAECAAYRGALGWALTPLPPQQATGAESTGFIHLTRLESGKRLDVLTTTSDGSSVTQQPAGLAFSQQWQLKPAVGYVGSDLYQLVNRASLPATPGGASVVKCLHLAGSPSGTSVPVQLWTCNGSTQQQWKLMPY